MVKYENGKIYKIWSPLGDKIYVGSTTKERLCQRMEAHRGDYNKWKNNKEKYKKITSFILFDEYGIVNCFIELLEAKNCQCKDELTQLEGKYIRELECVNRIIPGRTREEYGKLYRDTNKVVIFEKKKKYRLENKETIQEKKKADYAKNKEKVIERAKTNYEENKEAILEAHRVRYQENKEVLKQKRIQNKEKLSTQIQCECGGHHRYDSISKHIKSKMHINFIEEKKE